MLKSMGLGFIFKWIILSPALSEGEGANAGMIDLISWVCLWKSFLLFQPLE
jgi:hypothetical protein